MDCPRCRLWRKVKKNPRMDKGTNQRILSQCTASNFKRCQHTARKSLTSSTPGGVTILSASYQTKRAKYSTLRLLALARTTTCSCLPKCNRDYQEVRVNSRTAGFISRRTSLSPTCCSPNRSPRSAPRSSPRSSARWLAG